MQTSRFSRLEQLSDRSPRSPLSLLTPHHPIEQFLQNTLPSSPEVETNHHRYRPLLTRSSGNACQCAWSSASLQENVANPSDGSGIGWHSDRAKL
ncbi:hypothetical protein K435DRAFT_31103 [Dendrothele bispora CBS 962.96]|uniref:Uncharacterized protein n=1 Tax=Dendrothele bispora (strain CBS 962.96) TaxID=1314807 RepID=A0A4S8KTX6_DENBC|nr:hypothetical protein K435DRAFT_31103 [Dendrothele bispora CBS 962.96]